MRSFGEEAKMEESARGGAWTAGRPGTERAQEAREPGKRRKGGLVKSRRNAQLLHCEALIPQSR